jgi:hypothetical protein
VRNNKNNLQNIEILEESEANENEDTSSSDENEDGKIQQPSIYKCKFIESDLLSSDSEDENVQTEDEVRKAYRK